MKRDMNLCRQVLLAIENDALVPELMKTDVRILEYHYHLLHQASLVESIPHFQFTLDGKPHPLAFRLTWRGHDFLESIRDEQWYKKVLAELKERGVGITLDVLMRYIAVKTKEQLGVDT